MDTSAFIELRRGNQEAILCDEAIRDRRLPIYVTSTVVAETHRRFLFDFGHGAARQFLDRARSGMFQIVRPTEADEVDAIQLLDRYADLHMTLCDALSMAVMLRIGIARAFTYDRRHFSAAGFVVIPPLYI